MKLYQNSEENPFITIESLKIYNELLNTALGGNIMQFGDLITEIKQKTRYYITKDDVGYKIVDSGGE